MNFQQRIAKVQAVLRRKKLDALLVSHPDNRRYLSGYSAQDHGVGESAGLLLVPAHGQSWLLTDFRFKLQAETEARELHIALYPKGVFALLQDLLPDLGVRSLGFESHATLHSFAEKLAKLGEKVSFRPAATTGVVEGLRAIKDEEEIALLRASVRLNELVFQEVYDSLESGQSEQELAMIIESTMRHRGAERPSFNTIVAFGANSALPHAVPGAGGLHPGQPVMIDMGLVLNGYCSDMTRTFVVGTADDQYLKIHRLVRQAQQAATEVICAGVSAAKVDRAAREVIAAAGYGAAFGHALGHGVGVAVHEEPRLSSRNRKQLQAGMVVTVEPGIYLEGWGGVRLENMVVVREGSCEVLNQNSTWLDI